MFIEENHSEDTLKLNITGDIRFQTLIPFREKIIAVENSTPKNLIVDISGVDNIDSSAIGLLIRLYKHQKDHNKTLRIVNPSPRVVELLKFSSLADIID